MAKVIGDRVAAEIEGDFIVFLIGMRVNKLWKVGKWMPVAKAMGVMLKELYASDREQTGFLGHQPLSMFNMVQYWRSFDHLEAYARSQDDAHWPAWVAFNRAMKGAREDVGIWHETYAVPAGAYEAIYSGMPKMGLGEVSSLVPATGKKEAARQRMTAPSEPAGVQD